MTPLINTLFPVDLLSPLTEHPLNVGRTLWLLALPGWSGGWIFQDIARNYGTNSGSFAAYGGQILLHGGGVGGWVNDFRPGGGQSVRLDGSVNDYIQLRDTSGNARLSSFMSASDGTAAAWVRVTMTAASAAQAYGLPNILGDPVGNYWGLKVGTISGTTAIWAYVWDGAEKRTSGSYTQNAWTRAAWVHGGGTLYLYLNGLLAGSVAAGNVSVTSVVANVGDSGAPNFAGQVDDVAIWSRALSAGEVAEDYRQGIAGYPDVLNRSNPLALFSMPTPSGTPFGGNMTGNFVNARGRFVNG